MQYDTIVPYSLYDNFSSLWSNIKDSICTVEIIKPQVHNNVNIVCESKKPQTPIRKRALPKLAIKGIIPYSLKPPTQFEELVSTQIDYTKMTLSELKQIAIEKGIPIEGITSHKVLLVLLYEYHNYTNL